MVPHTAEKDMLAVDEAFFHCFCWGRLGVVLEGSLATDTKKWTFQRNWSLSFMLQHASLKCHLIAGVKQLNALMCRSACTWQWIRELMWLMWLDAQVTHFPCGHKTKYYKEMHLKLGLSYLRGALSMFSESVLPFWSPQFLFLKTFSKAFSLFQLRKYGLDLLVTGHAHYQLMYWSPVSRLEQEMVRVRSTKGRWRSLQKNPSCYPLLLPRMPQAAAADLWGEAGRLEVFHHWWRWGYHFGEQRGDWQPRWSSVPWMGWVETLVENRRKTTMSREKKRRKDLSETFFFFLGGGLGKGIMAIVRCFSNSYLIYLLLYAAQFAEMRELVGLLHLWGMAFLISPWRRRRSRLNPSIGEDPLLCTKVCFRVFIFFWGSFVDTKMGPGNQEMTIFKETIENWLQQCQVK